MEEINKLFIEFLKNNHALKQYVKNLRNSISKKLHFQTWENHTNPFTIMPLRVSSDDNLIINSFWWEGTLEGYDFWEGLDKKWREIYHSHKHNLNI